MKYIKKVAVSPIPEINGSVVDSFNVEDKTTNAPSINSIENMLINGTIGNFVLEDSSLFTVEGEIRQVGKVVFVDIMLIALQKITANTKINFTISGVALPRRTIFPACVYNETRWAHPKGLVNAYFRGTGAGTVSCDTDLPINGTIKTCFTYLTS